MKRKEDVVDVTKPLHSTAAPDEAGTSGETFRIGMKLNGRYTIASELGRGGIGVVYLARDEQLHSRPVVIKVLLEESNQQSYFKEKFHEELEALCRLNNPWIVDVFDKGELPDGEPYFVMEFIEGVKLRSVMGQQGMDLPRAANILRQVGRALSAAHDKHICHRDLKPENIMLQLLGEGEEHVKLIDFGIATVADPDQLVSNPSTQIVGTIPYMAPEQLQGKPTTASDIYALGVIAYEMLTGRLPFQPPSPYQLLDLQRAGVKVKPMEIRPEIPKEAQDDILKALSFKQENRHARAKDLGDELAQHLSVAPAPSAKPRAVDDAFLFESGDGAVPLDSPFYIARPVDQNFYSAIERQHSIVLLKGARQMGKTSLLARGLQRARESGASVVLTDFQMLNTDELESVGKFLLALAGRIADRLNLDVSPEDFWNTRHSPSRNFERYMRREILDKSPVPVVWGLDEADRLLACSYANEVFGLFRSWHNARQLDPSGPWQRLTLIISYAIEAHMLITDPHQSPFNVGTKLMLEDFSPEQVSELNRLYGSPLAGEDEVSRYFHLVGGHPYLVRRGLYEMATHRKNLTAFEANADRAGGPYGDHLNRITTLLKQNPALCDAVKEVLRGNPCPNSDSFYKLRSAGLLSGDFPLEARLRCQLYVNYLQQYL